MTIVLLTPLTAQLCHEKDETLLSLIAQEARQKLVTWMHWLWHSEKVLKKEGLLCIQHFLKELSSTLSNDYRGFIIMAWLKSLCLALCLNVSCGLALGSFWGWFWEFHCEGGGFKYLFVWWKSQLVYEFSRLSSGKLFSLKPTAKAPENGLLEDASLLGRPIFSRYVSCRE